MFRTRRILHSLIGAAVTGAAGIVILLAALFPFYLALHIDYAPAIITDTIIESTPADNAIALQNTLGPLSFPFALMGGIMLTAMSGLLVGIVYGLLKHRSAALATGAASILFPLLLWLAFPVHMTLAALLPLAAIGPLLALITRHDPPLGRDLSSSVLSRRAVLARAAIFGFGGLLLSAIDSFPAYQFALNAAKTGARLFDFTPPGPRTADFPAPGSVPEVTDVAEFYVMRKSPNAVPPALPDWKLTFGGLVTQPAAFTLADIQALPRVDVFLTRECISNPVGGKLISTALMSGVRLADVLTKDQISPEAGQLVFYGRDGYSESVPIDYALSNGLLIYAMNGVLLPDAHGAPLKVEIPGMYGFKSMKWLTRIEVVAAPYQSVWTQAGWTSAASVKTMCRIDAIVPTADGAIISGIAYAGLHGISRVEVQINGGAWQPAVLNDPPLSNKTWVQWRLNTTLRGNLTVVVRATDEMGTLQIADKQTQFPDGASGWHTVMVHV